MPDIQQGGGLPDLNLKEVTQNWAHSIEAHVTFCTVKTTGSSTHPSYRSNTDSLKAKVKINWNFVKTLTVVTVMSTTTVPCLYFAPQGLRYRLRLAPLQIYH